MKDTILLKNIVWGNNSGPATYELKIDTDYVHDLLNENDQLEPGDVIEQIVYEDLPEVCKISEYVISFDWCWK